MQVAPPKAELAPGQSVVLSVTVPAEKLAISAADITVASSETNTVRLSGAGPDGTLVLHYAKGGGTTQTVEAVAVRRGTASVNIPESAGLVVPNGVLIHVVESFVRNPSFEAAQAPSGDRLWSKSSLGLLKALSGSTLSASHLRLTVVPSLIGSRWLSSRARAPSHRNYWANPGGRLLAAVPLCSSQQS